MPTLRKLLNTYDPEISNVGFARRLRKDPLLGRAVCPWLDWAQQPHKRLFESIA